MKILDQTQNLLNQTKFTVGEKNQLSLTDHQRDLKLKQSSKELESVFIVQMLKAMEKTIEKSSLSKSNNNLSTMLFSAEMGKEIANQGGIGLADMIYKGLKDRQDLPSIPELEYDPNIYFNTMSGITDLKDE